MAAYGLYTHIQANRRRSIVLLIGLLLLVYVMTYAGALAAEAILFFDPKRAEMLGFRRKRAGQLWSKMRFLAAQMDAYLADDLWLANARHANRMAGELSAGLAAIPGATVEHPVEANEILVRLPESVIRGLEGDGFRFYRWMDESSTLLRLVTAFDTRAEHVAWSRALRRWGRSRVRTSTVSWRSTRRVIRV